MTPASGSTTDGAVRATALDDVETGRRLSAWLGDRGAVTVSRLTDGHSNLTYGVSGAGVDWVLRRPPAGPLLPTAHDVLREFRFLDLLSRASRPVRVPRLVAACEDSSVLGSPFYLMEQVPGTVVRTALPGWCDEASQRRLACDLVDALVEIHRVEPAPFVEAGLGRPAGYLERQVRRWAGQREGIERAVAAGGGRARALPDYDRVRDWLSANLPDERPATVVHGDFKLDNVVVAVDRPEVSGVLDWEMAAVGDPRADLGYLLSFWPEPGESHPLARLLPAGTGFPGRDELVRRWEAGTCRTAEALRWFVTLALWKLAVLLEASYHRYLAGTTDDPFFATLDDGVPALLRHAREVCGG